MKITLLGTGTPTPSLKRASSGYLIEIGDDRIVMDHGPGSHHRLIESGTRAVDVTHVFLSHLHYDHCMEYPRLVLQRWDMGADLIPDLQVYGPSPLARMTEQLFSEDGVWGPDIRARISHQGSIDVFEFRGLYFMPQGIAGFIEGRRRERSRDAHRLPAPDVEGLKASMAERRMPGGGGSLVEIAGVSKAFGGLVALDDLTMEIRPGAIHSLIGPNGAGKTTLVNVLSGFYRPEAGEVRLAGERVSGWSAHRMAARGVARTFQATRLFPQLTVLANVMVGLHQHMDYGLAPALFSTPRTRTGERRAEAEALAALEIVGYSGDPLASAGALAFGHQRLVEIARALVTRPALLLLDEPAAGLSASEIEALDKLIVRVRELGVTVLLIEHHMDLVMEISDRVTVLDYGRKIAEGRPEVVRADRCWRRRKGAGIRRTALVSRICRVGANLL